MRALIVICAVLVIGWVQGCSQIPLVGEPRANPYLKYKHAQNWQKALEVAREEIKTPITSDKEYLINIRIIGIQALGDYGAHYGYDANMDAEAERYFREIDALSNKDSTKRAGALHVLGNYYSKTGRNGRGSRISSG